MFNPSRDQARRYFIEAWAKYRDKRPLEPQEARVADIILRHPEYHALLEDDRHIDRDWTPEMGETNPFLHLAMHLALAEQMGIDQPLGIRARLAALARHLGDEHAALHEAMDCLAEMIWRAQRDGTPPDGEAYLRCLERKARWDTA